ncbi:HPP family protein [Sinirhodobacter sp. HNIBRBA609]|nr:HPP family protein [Sinirhodobacter sp. HNIBRBA609]
MTEPDTEKPTEERPTNKQAHLVRRLGPAMGRRRTVDILRAGTGAGLGIMVTALISYALPQSREAGIYLISGFASTAVLLFALPNSPLAQPWSAIVGMMVSAASAVVVLRFVPPPYADGLAVALAICAMMALRALHPPAAGIALLGALEYEAGRPLGFDFVLMPVGAITVVLVLLAMAWHRTFGVAYPSRPLAAPPRPGPAARSTPRLSEDDLASLLLEFQQSANLGTADLARLLNAARTRVTETLLSASAGSLMSPRPVSVGPEAPMSEVVRKMEMLDLRSLPVADSEGRYVGMVDQGRVLQRLEAEQATLRRPFRLRSAPPEPDAAALMDSTTAPVDISTPVGELMARLAKPGAQAIPVTENARLVGILGRSDVMSLLLSLLMGDDPKVT